MLKSRKGLLFIVILILGLTISSYCYADYPLLTTITYSADPSCLEYNGVLYSYWSNDDNNNGSYSMHEITCLSTTDLKHWTNHGQVFRVPQNCSWASNSWAPAVVYRNGYFWMYFGNGASGIGVAKSSSPTGPFTDAKGSALITSSMPNCNVQWCFDPGVLVDDDGRVYMFFGGGGPGNARGIEIGSDMISTVGTAVTINAPYFFEDSWIHKYNGKYYYSYSSDFSRGAATIEYMMSSSPLSGYVAKGTAMPNPPDNSGNNNHHSIFQYKGNWYIGYHNRYVAIQQGIDTTYKRNACLDQLFYNADGTIKLVACTKSGLPLLGGNTPTPTRSSTPTPTRVNTPTPTSRQTPTQRVTPTPTSRVNNTPTTRPNGSYVVSYVISSDWGVGANADVTIKNNTASAVNGWTLAFTFPGNQKITNLWNGTYTQSGASVSVKDAGYNSVIGANGGTTSLGFGMTYTGTNAKPTAFTLNGTACQVQ